MKKFLVFLVMFLMLSPVFAEDIDISGLSYDQLIALKNRINLAIWECEEWQEVTVPQGLWEVGKDIPAGTWTVRCADTGRKSYLLKSCKLEWGDTLDANGQGVAWSRRYDHVEVYNPYSDDYEGEVTEYTFTVQAGDYIYIDPFYNKAVFTPYTGKPDLGFK